VIVISDTSPITNLSAIGKFDLLNRLFGEVYIPSQVRDELNSYGGRWPGAGEIEQAEWVHVGEIANLTLFQTLQRDLDAGEAASIVLALELNADVILMDEREGRRAAARVGIEAVGVLGILLAAKSQKHILRVRPLLDALKQDAGFYIDDGLYKEVIRLAQEEEDISSE
jgi:hypothetical protein